MKNPFRELTAEHVRAVQLRDAEQHALEHAALAEEKAADAEHHLRLAAMYATRIARLQGAVA